MDVDISRINVSQLLALYLVVSEQSFTAAAKKLNLTESAVSQKLNSLEKSIGVDLHHIRKKKIFLTEYGATLYNYAQELYNTACKAQNYINQIKRGGLSVGFCTSFSCILSSSAAQFQDIYPDIKLYIGHGTTKEMMTQLLDRKYDLVIVMKTEEYAENIRSVRISSGEKFILVTGWTTKIDGVEPFYLSDLARHTFIIPREGSAARDLLLNRFKAENIEPRNFTTTGTNYYQYGKMLAEMGNGIAMMPESYAQDDIDTGKLRILRLRDDVKVDVDALFLKSTPDYIPATVFVHLVKNAFGKLHNKTAKVT